MLRPVVDEERGGADGGVPLPGGEVAASAGEELPDSGGFGRNFLLWFRSDDDVGVVDYRERAAAGDTCRVQSGEIDGGVLAE